MGRFLWILSICFTTGLAIGLVSHSVCADENVATANWLATPSVELGLRSQGMIESDSLGETDAIVEQVSFETALNAGSDRFLDTKSLMSIANDTDKDKLPSRIGLTMNYSPDRWGTARGVFDPSSQRKVGDFWAPGIAGQLSLERWLDSPVLLRFSGHSGSDHEIHPALLGQIASDSNGTAESNAAFTFNGNSDVRIIDYERSHMEVEVGKVVNANSFGEKLKSESGMLEFGMRYTSHFDQLRRPAIYYATAQSQARIRTFVDGIPLETMSRNHIVAPYLMFQRSIQRKNFRIGWSLGAFGGLNVIERSLATQNTNIAATANLNTTATVSSPIIMRTQRLDPESTFTFGEQIRVDGSYQLNDHWYITLSGGYQRIENVSTAFSDGFSPGPLTDAEFATVSLAVTSQY